MKKLYSLLTVMLASVLMSVTALAATKTVTVTVDNPEAVYYYDSSYMSCSFPGSGSVEFTFGQYGGQSFQANYGWKILDVKAASGKVFNTADNPTDYVWVGETDLTDGDVVTITTGDASEYAKKVIISGNPDHFNVRYQYEDIELDPEGTLTIAYADYSSITLNVKPGFEFTTITDQTGLEYRNNGFTCDIYTSTFPTVVTELTVGTVDASTIDRPKFTASVVGHPYKVQMQNTESYAYVTLTEEPQEISFREGTQYTIGPASYTYTIYKVEVNGTPLDPSYGTWYYRPAAGDELVVYTEYPEIEVPFAIEFGGNADASVISAFRYDGQLLDPSVWNSGSWQPLLGKAIDLTFNDTDFEDIALEVNGNTIGLYGTPSYSFNVTDPAGYTLKVSGSTSVPYNVTIAAADLSKLLVAKGYTGQYYDLGDATTTATISVARSNNTLKFEAADGWKVGDIYVNGEKDYNPVYVYGDYLIEVELIEVKRDMTAVVYVQPSAWDYLSFTLAPSDYDFRTDVNIEPGYNFINYGDFDLPFGLGYYPMATTEVYLNSEQIANEYGNWPALADYKEGDVIKIFADTPGVHTVTYNIADEANATVTHDHLTAVANPSAHNVFTGTQVHVAPATDAPIAVTLNGEPLEAAADGRFAFTVEADTDVTVKPLSAGIGEIEAGDAEAPAEYYNLQGIRVDNPAAGIFIRRTGNKVEKVTVK